MITTQPGQATTPGTSLDDAAIVFPDGLIGCPDWKRFVLLVDEEEELPVAVLRSLDDPQVELLVTDPALVAPEYVSHLPMHAIGAGDPAVYCTLSIGEDGWITANLMGPLVIDPTTRQGRQVVLADSSYTTRHPVVQTAVQAA
jgi:flagellar assembly factor FliW